MCGIGLAISPNKDLHFAIADKICAFQSHRGPDNFTINSYENFSLCHQRLSIIDLHQRSNQPFKYKHLELSFNGEIYNYKE